MANINLLTPTSIYGRTVTFLTGTELVTSNIKYVIGNPVETGKTHLVMGLLASSPQVCSVKLYKRSANQTDSTIVERWQLPASYNGITTAGNPGGIYPINFFSKELGGGFYLQEGESLVMELLGSTGYPISPIAGFLTYLEIS